MTRSSFSPLRRLAAAVAALAFVGLAGIAAGAASPPLQVSSTPDDVSTLLLPAGRGVAASADGRFFVTWGQPTGEGDQFRVWGRVIGKDGAPETQPFPISRLGADGEPVSALGAAATARGRRNEFLLTWIQTVGDSPRQTRVGQWYNSQGKPLSEEFELGVDVSGGSIAYGAKRDEFLLAWVGVERGEVRIARLRAGATQLRHSRRLSPYGDPGEEGLATRAITTGVAYDSEEANYLVDWNGPADDGYRAVYGRIVRANPMRKPGRTRLLTEPGAFPFASVAFSRYRAEFIFATDKLDDDGDSVVFIGRIDQTGRRVGRLRTVAGGGDGLNNASLAGIKVARDGRALITFNGNATSDENRANWVFYRWLGRSLKPRRLHKLSTGGEDVRATAATSSYSRALDAFGVVWTQGLGPESAGPPEDSPRHEVFYRMLTS